MSLDYLPSSWLWESMVSSFSSCTQTQPYKHVCPAAGSDHQQVPTSAHGLSSEWLISLLLPPEASSWLLIRQRVWPDKCTDQLMCSWLLSSLSLMLVHLQSMLSPPYLPDIEALYNSKKLFLSISQWSSTEAGSNLPQLVRWPRKPLPRTSGRSTDGFTLTALRGAKAGGCFSAEVTGIPSLITVPLCALSVCGDVPLTT